MAKEEAERHLSVWATRYQVDREDSHATKPLLTRILRPRSYEELCQMAVEVGPPRKKKKPVVVAPPRKKKRKRRWPRGLTQGGPGLQIIFFS
jgi:hypothetical protein